MHHLLEAAGIARRTEEEERTPQLKRTPRGRLDGCRNLFSLGLLYILAQFFPYMGDNLIQQSVSLLHIKDPLFKRMGASRISRFATDDERRTKIIEMDGIERLVSMLEGATDDCTRKAALKALDALSHTDAAIRALHKAGAVAIIKSTPNSSDGEVAKYKSNLFKRFQDLKYETPLMEMEIGEKTSISCLFFLTYLKVCQQQLSYTIQTPEITSLPSGLDNHMT